MLDRPNKLELLSFINQKYGEEKTNFLIKDPLRERIKEWLVFVIPTVTAIIAILGFILRS